MNERERFLSVMHFEAPDDRLPMVEWGWWWDKTHDRWRREGLPPHLGGEGLFDYFGLDHHMVISGGGVSELCPQPAYHGAPRILDEKGYDEAVPYILNDSLISKARGAALAFKDRHDRGEVHVRLWLDGFFWFPRSLLGIENHFYAFYDMPWLVHRMNRELAEFDMKVMEEVFSVLTPDMVGFAEDMSYNKGPMLSREMFREFMAPYYRKVVPFIKGRGVKVFVDSDGDVTNLIPWFLDLGFDGIFPLERQAGVDIAALRQKFPGLLIMGAYDKMVMSKGEAAMRGEFERLLPVMRAGGYIPACDHQVPPEVSLENYMIYLRLYEEYCVRAVRGA